MNPNDLKNINEEFKKVAKKSGSKKKVVYIIDCEGELILTDNKKQAKDALTRTEYVGMDICDEARQYLGLDDFKSYEITFTAKEIKKTKCECCGGDKYLI